MPEKYNFSVCCRLLATNPKTFKGWLEKAQIDSRKQVNAADPREKYLTREQVQLLAKEHERILPPLDEEETVVAASAMTIEDLAEQLAANHAQTTAFFTEMTHSFRHVLSLVQEQGEHRQLPQVEPEPRVEESPMDVEPGVQPIPEEVSSSATPKKPTRAAAKGKSKSTVSRSPRKAKSKGKSLPRTLVPLRVFADQHQIEMRIADRASESKKIAVVRGRWLSNSRLVAKVLDDAGKRSFYTYFSVQEGFLPCEQCPHGAEEQSGSRAG